MARVDAARPRIGVLIPTAKKYPSSIAATTTTVTKASACRLSSLTPASARACFTLRSAITAQFSSGSVLYVPIISTERLLSCRVNLIVAVLRRSGGSPRTCSTSFEEPAAASVPGTKFFASGCATIWP